MVWNSFHVRIDSRVHGFYLDLVEWCLELKCFSVPISINQSLTSCLYWFRFVLTFRTQWQPVRAEKHDLLLVSNCLPTTTNTSTILPATRGWKPAAQAQIRLQWAEIKSNAWMCLNALCRVKFMCWWQVEATTTTKTKTFYKLLTRSFRSWDRREAVQ